MKFITIDPRFAALCSDPEMMQKSDKRPHIVVLKLTYKGKKLNFAVPMRSNIPPSAAKSDYFPLPPRTTTKPKHRHGLHYIKMFPITKKYYRKFNVGKNPSYVLFQSIITKNTKQIVTECQDYLNRYAAGNIPVYAVDIDAIIAKLGI